MSGEPFERRPPSLAYYAGLVVAVGVLALSLLPQSAAASLVWPWCIVWAGIAVGMPAAAAWSVARQGFLPSRAWVAAWVFWCGWIVLSHVLSPVRSQLGVWGWSPLFLPAVALYTAVLSRQVPNGTAQIVRYVATAALVISIVSLVLHLSDIHVRYAAAEPDSVKSVLALFFHHRNSEPLGHVNYTAGAALLLLPYAGWQAYSCQGWRRVGWAASFLAVLLMFITGGSRGGYLGIGAMLATAVLIAIVRVPPSQRKAALIVGGVLVAVGVAAVFSQSRMRALIIPAPPPAAPNLSNLERITFLKVGAAMGLARPFSGWGAGAVPLVYEKYRRLGDYGPGNMLQLHSTPMQLWAEGGVLALAAMAGLTLVTSISIVRLVRRPGPLGVDYPAALSLTGYAVFALTDFQLDLPLISAGVGVGCGLLMGSTLQPALTTSLSIKRWVAALVFAVVALLQTFAAVPWVGARRALASGRVEDALGCTPHDSALWVLAGLDAAARGRAEGEAPAREVLNRRAIGCFERALALGSSLEAAHLNLGWLELGENPRAADTHFRRVLAITPNRPGAWLGRALAASAVGDEDGAVEKLAMECIVSPRFLFEGQWAHAPLLPLRSRVLQRLGTLLAVLRTEHLWGNVWPSDEALRLQGWARWAITADAPAPEGLGAVRARMEQAAGDPFYCGSMVQRWVLQTAPDALNANLPRRAIAFLAQGTPERQLRSLVEVRADDLPPLVRYHASRAGHGVRMRLPYLAWVADVPATSRSVLAECLVAPELPRDGWLPDPLLLKLAPQEAPATSL